MQFPTWTIYGGQDDLIAWTTNILYTGTNLGNDTWKYHVNISDHNNEAGKYITHVYVLDNNGNWIVLYTNINAFVETVNYIGSLYLSDADSVFNNDKYYRVGSETLTSNFTFEFEANPNVAIPIISIGEWSDTSLTHNYVIWESYTSEEEHAGIGLSIGTNGAMAVAHGSGYYYSLLVYTGSLSGSHRYKFTIVNNVPKLYVDGVLVATGIEPTSPVTTLITHGFVGQGTYGGFSGTANNFVLYNNAR